MKKTRNQDNGVEHIPLKKGTTRKREETRGERNVKGFDPGMRKKSRIQRNFEIRGGLRELRSAPTETGGGKRSRKKTNQKPPNAKRRNPVRSGDLGSTYGNEGGRRITNETMEQPDQKGPTAGGVTLQKYVAHRGQRGGGKAKGTVGRET